MDVKKAAAALRALADAIEDDAGGAAPKATTKSAPKATTKSATKATTKPTADAVSKALRHLADEKGKPRAVEILETYGGTKQVAEVDEARYALLIEAATAAAEDKELPPVPEGGDAGEGEEDPFKV